LWQEAIATATHGLDATFLARGLERQPQSADVHVDRALLDEHLIAPDAIEQSGAL
jgi:hypothetical protein